MKMNASEALEASVLVPWRTEPSGLMPPPDFANSAEATVMASQTTVQALKEKRRRGRRPTFSTSMAPRMANANCWQLLIRVMLACSI